MSNPSRRKASVAPDTCLPPISESPRSSSRSPVASYAHTLDEKKSPFRRNSRKPSSTTAVPQPTPASSSVDRRQSITLLSRRQSEVIKRHASITQSTSEAIMRHIDVHRKSSVLNIMPNRRRTSFGTVGARITTLLKAKNAFTRLCNRPQANEDAENAEEQELKIERLPPKPCFAATLSAEAQYAMMKGYEDVIYSNLCRQYPEYRPMLRRNRTPMCGINVKHHIYDEEEQTVCSNQTNGNNPSDKVNRAGDNAAVSEDDDLFSHGGGPEANPALKPGHSQSKAPTDKKTPPASPRSVYHTKHAVTNKENTIHKVQRETREKRLVMTYRYQRAMDILDKLRTHQGVNALSPRVKTKTVAEPLKDYNSWSCVWTREFEPKTGIA